MMVSVCSNLTLYLGLVSLVKSPSALICAAIEFGKGFYSKPPLCYSGPKQPLSNVVLKRLFSLK